MLDFRSSSFSLPNKKLLQSSNLSSSEPLTLLKRPNPNSYICAFRISRTCQRFFPYAPSKSKHYQPAGPRGLGTDPTSPSANLLWRVHRCSLSTTTSSARKLPSSSSPLARSYLIPSGILVGFLISSDRKCRQEADTRFSVTAIITMSHMQDASLNPSSPHSSSVGADSYKHENTPDTRLTVFSPDDISTRQNKVDSPSCSVQYHTNPSKGFGNPTTTTEKDPFTSSTASKAERKLSPTALVFRPVSAPLVAYGSPGSPNVRNATGPGMVADRQLLVPRLTTKFSSELGISRYLIIYSPALPVSVTDIEGYFAVGADINPRLT